MDTGESCRRGEISITLYCLGEVSLFILQERRDRRFQDGRAYQGDQVSMREWWRVALWTKSLNEKVFERL